MYYEKENYSYPQVQQFYSNLKVIKDDLSIH